MKRTLIVLLTLVVAFITPSAFALNRVLSLDGDGDYVEVPDADSLDLTDNFTFEVWVFPIATSGDNMIFNKERTYQWAIRDGNLQWALETSVIWDWHYTGLSMPVNQWTHLALTYDSKNVSVYGNGLLLSTIVHPQGGKLDANDSALRIGARSRDIPYSFFAGLIDEVRIWNIVRTQEDIQATMHTTLSSKEPGLVSYWRFDDDQNIATDLSPSHSDGKLMGDAHCVEAELPKQSELVIPTVLSGRIMNESGQPIPNASVRLELDGEKITQTQADTSGIYRIAIFHPARGLYALSATRGEKNAWRFGIRLREAERPKLNLILKKSSIEGTLLMLDDATPHVRVPIESIRNGKVIATTFSDESGKYRFINLKPGKYQVRCQILNGYVYYGEGGREAKGQKDNGFDTWFRYASHSTGATQPKSQFGEILQVEPGKTLKNIDFRFPPFKKGTWKTYTTLDGLASSIVTAIHRDPDGVMWFGTYGGVSRYDGKQFVNLTQKDGWANNGVLSLYADSDGTMWFGTLDGGVCRYDGKSPPLGKGGKGGFKTFTEKDGLGSNTIGAIYRDRDGAIWFGTGYNYFPSLCGGVSRYDGKEFKTFTQKDGLADNRVLAIHQDSDGVMWFGTWRGVSRYDGKDFETFTQKDGLASNQVYAICSDPDGMLWFATWYGGVSRYDGNQF